MTTLSAEQAYTGNIIPLFPTAIGEYNIGRSITEKELQLLSQLKQRNNQGNTTSDSSYIFDEHNELKDLYNFCQQSLNDFFNKLYQPISDIKIYMTQSWCNYTKYNQYHHVHQHPNSIISGVLYVQFDSDDKIIFHRNIEYSRIKINSMASTPFNADNWWLPCKNSNGYGALYLFDSSVEHGVNLRQKGKFDAVTENDLPRISISFNSFISGNIGDEKSLSGLTLGEKVR